MATTRKTSIRRKTATKTPKTTASRKRASVKKSAATPTVVKAPKPVVAGPALRKRELVDAVIEHSGRKKKDVKPIVESMLVVLGSALQDGRELNLQPMGKVKINREKKLTEGKVLMARIRQPKDLPPLSVSGNVPAAPVATVKKPDAAE